MDYINTENRYKKITLILIIFITIETMIFLSIIVWM